MAFFPISPIPQAGGNFLASMNAFLFSWCALSPTKILLAYCQASPLKLYVQILNFNGTSAPTLGIPTFIGDIVGTPDQVNIKVDAFDSSTAMLMWTPVTSSNATVTYNFSVLNIDVSDNIIWNVPTAFSDSGRTNCYGGTILKCLSSTTAMFTNSNGAGTAFNRRITRTGNSVSIVANTPNFATSYTMIATAKKLPTAGVVFNYTHENGTSRGLGFANSSATIIPITGVSGADTTEVMAPVTDNLIHCFKSTNTAGTLIVRPLNVNIGAATGNWITADQYYNVPSWPAPLYTSLLDVIPIDNEYFILMGSSIGCGFNSSYATATYSFCVGRYIALNGSYLFASRFTAAAAGVPLWGGRHLHFINPTTIASFAIQGAAGNQQLGVNILYL